MKSLSLFMFACVLSCFSGSASAAASISRTIVVDLNGRGDYKSVQEAVDSIPEGNQQWVQIHVTSGTYWEKVIIPSTKPFIVLQGEGSDKTFIEFNDGATSLKSYEQPLLLDSEVVITTSNSSTFTNFASDFVARDISFVNSYNKNRPENMPAVAVYLRGDRSSFYRCSFFSYQDTLSDYEGRHLFQDCFIQGAIDFIWGLGRSIYLDCTLNAIGYGFLTAHAKTSEEAVGGFVFKNCKIFASTMTYLGRAWNSFATVVFYNTSIPAQIYPLGWVAWNAEKNPYLTTYIEEENYGAGSSTLGRVEWMKKTVTGAELSNFITPEIFIGPDDWVHEQP